MAHQHFEASQSSMYSYDDDRSFRSYHSSNSDQSYQESPTESDRSYQTRTTAPSSCSGSPPKRPTIVHHETCDARLEYGQEALSTEPEQYFDDRRASVETYASTVQSSEDLQDDTPQYQVPEYTYRHPGCCEATPATPADFSELFPSKRRLAIRHDDSTLDGNMNLRIDTQVHSGSRKCDITLFHLRMHDLQKREFSLRRYCRDSGREVCHSVRKYQTPAAEKRPAFQRSLSNALASFRPKSEPKTMTLASLKRADSGYASMHSMDLEDSERPKIAGDTKHHLQPPTKTVKLEFSNYAQVEVKRRGVKANKRYEYEYWGEGFAWKRIVRKNGSSKEVSYHLVRAKNEQKVLAYIMPEPLTNAQRQEEQAKGGWIPPVSMWIADEHICHRQKDISDVIVASGLIALVDDNIKQNFHSRTSKHLLIPVPKFQLGMEYVGPKRLINEVFGRKDNANSRPNSRPVTSYSTDATPTTLRQVSYEL